LNIYVTKIYGTMIIKNNFNVFQYVLIVIRELLNSIEVHIKT
jgi:hypothetical protein